MEMEATPVQEIIEEEVSEELCVFAAAKAFKEEMAKREKKAKRKSDRFVNVTPQNDRSRSNNTSLDDNSIVNMNVTSSFMFNDSALASKASSVVHTPVPKHPGFKMSQSHYDNEKTPPLPTPMALRDISMRAQECLADLYKDNLVQDDMTLDETYQPYLPLTNANLKPQVLFEDDENEDTTSGSGTIV